MLSRQEVTDFLKLARPDLTEEEWKDVDLISGLKMGVTLVSKLAG